MKRRPLIFWLLAAAFLAGVVFWAFHVPRDAQAPFRAIPANATWVFAHYRLADRWPLLADNPLVASVAQAVGIEPQEWAALAHDPETRRFLERFARDEFVLAYVPQMGITGRPAWIFAAWLGGRSQHFRWMLKSSKNPTLRPAATRNGWRVWVWTPHNLKSGERITFALLEGLAVGCIAQDTLGIEEVLACADGLIPSVADNPALSVFSHRESPDRGWLRLPTGGARPGSPIHFQFSIRPDGSIGGRLLAPDSQMAGSTLGKLTNAALESVRQFFGDRPAATLLIDRRLASHWIRQVWDGPAGRKFAEIIERSAGPVGVALLTGEYSGRFRSVRLPALAIAIGSDNPDKTLADARDALKLVGTAIAAQFSLNPVSVDGIELFEIQAAGNSLFAQLPREERFALKPLNDAVILCSSFDVLVKLAREATGKASDTPEVSAPDAVEAGRTRLPERAALGYGTFDLERSAKPLRLALTAWSLKLLVEQPTESEIARRRLDEAKDWIDALAAFRTLRVWVRPLQEGMEFEFLLGEP